MLGNLPSLRLNGSLERPIFISVECVAFIFCYNRADLFRYIVSFSAKSYPHADYLSLSSFYHCRISVWLDYYRRTV